MIIQISSDPNNPSYYFPVIAGYLLIMVTIYILDFFIKSKYGHGKHPHRIKKHENEEISHIQETLNPAIEYNDDIAYIKEKLRVKYLTAYLLTKASMWAKSPYMYTLFSVLHGFTMEQIGFLYVVDGITALIFGPILGNLADIFGRKFFCMLYCLTTVINLSFRCTGNIPLAYAAQVLTGLGAGLINTNFESWLNCETRKQFANCTNDEAESRKAMERFLKKLFKAQNLYDAVCSVCVSFSCAVLYTIYGIFAPFIVSSSLAGIAFFVILFTWSENSPNSESKGHFTESINDALRELKKRDVLSIGIIESFFQGVSALFLFIYTPILLQTAQSDINIGVIFICFVLGIITGTMIYEV